MEIIISEFTDALGTIIGIYEPIENTITIVSDEVVVVAAADGSETVQIVEVVEARVEDSINWNWFAGLAMFTLILFCFFKAVGGLLKCKI